jgi:hypothetical protein
MKRLLPIFLLAFPLSLTAQNNTSKETQKTSAKETAAKEFKAGEFTMKQYFFVMLTKGTRRGELTDTSSNWRGIFIFNCPTQEEVEALLKTDPAIAAGRLGYEIHPWWTAKNSVFK